MYLTWHFRVLGSISRECPAAVAVLRLKAPAVEESKADNIGLRGRRGGDREPKKHINIQICFGFSSFQKFEFFSCYWFPLCLAFGLAKQIFMRQIFGCFFLSRGDALMALSRDDPFPATTLGAGKRAP